MLRLLSLLQGRREWSGAELAERLGVTDRTVRRDVDRLRGLGYPVRGTTGTAGGYRLQSGRDLPPLLLDDDEAVAITVALRTASGVVGVGEAAVRALAKLEQVLPARLRGPVAALDESLVAVPGDAHRAVDAAALTVLAVACRDREIVTFGYRRRDGTATERRVEPYRLLTNRGYWYLFAFDLARDGWRSFRLDRIGDPRPTRLRFTGRDPVPDPAEHVRRGLVDAPTAYTATVTVDASGAQVRARLPALVPTRITAGDGGTSAVRLASDDPAHLLRDLLALGPGCSLDAAPEVRARLAELARDLLRVVAP